jgi:hypothetical protein
MMISRSMENGFLFDPTLQVKYVRGHIKRGLGFEDVAHWYSTCLACARLWVHLPALKKKRETEREVWTRMRML